MPRFEIYRTLSQSARPIRKLSALNPLTIHKKGTRTKAFFALALVCFLWGTTWIASKEGVKHMPALQMAGVRQLIAGLCYVAFFIAKKTPLPQRKEWVAIFILSLLNFALSNGLTTWGVKYISAGLGAIIGAIFPLWLVVIGLFSDKEKMPARAIAGLAIGFAGVCIIFYEHLGDFLNPGFRFGIFVSLLATWTWALGTFYTKKRAASFNPYFSLGLQMTISGILLLLLTGLTGNASTFIPVKNIPWQSWAAIGYLVIFGSLIAFVAYLYALQHLPTEQASIYAYINPVVAVILGSFFFSEKITLFIIIGGIIAMLGVYLVNKTFKALPPAEQPENEAV